MGDVDVDYELSGPGASAMFSVRDSVRYMGRIVLRLHLGFSSDVRVTARLNYSVIVRLG